LSDPDVVFAGYKVPHPLKHTTVIKVQTNHNSSPGTSDTHDTRTTHARHTHDTRHTIAHARIQSRVKSLT
jgi:DNA-directed RNA polymerase subunit L